MTEFEPVIGTWWVETDPGHRVPGYVELTPDEPSFPWRLTIDGQLFPKLPLGVDQTVTIFGDTPAGEFTLQRAARSSWFTNVGGERVMQKWRGDRLLSGGHLGSGTVFNWAVFRLPHLWNWFGPTRGNQHAENMPEPGSDSAGENEWIDAELVDGITLSLGRVKTSSFEMAGHRTTTHWLGTYSIKSDVGFTEDQFHTVCDGMAKLHSLVMSVPVEPYMISFGSGEPLAEGFSVIPAGAPAGEELSGGREPFFDTSEIDFALFTREWLRLYNVAPIVASVIAPRDERAYVTTRLTDVCNGVEALATQRWGSIKSELPQADVAILDALKAAEGVPTKSRRRVETLLRRDWTLQSKLELLVQDLGEESSRWLLGPSVSDWALLVVRLRNSVAHGSVLPGGLSTDAHFLTFAYETLAAVLQLAVFRVCGYANPQAEAGGEILRSPGKFVASHPYSTFYKKLEQLAQQAGFWAQWRQRLENS